MEETSYAVRIGDETVTLTLAGYAPAVLDILQRAAAQPRRAEHVVSYEQLSADLGRQRSGLEKTVPTIRRALLAASRGRSTIVAVRGRGVRLGVDLPQQRFLDGPLELSWAICKRLGPWSRARPTERRALVIPFLDVPTMADRGTYRDQRGEPSCACALGPGSWGSRRRLAKCGHGPRSEGKEVSASADLHVYLQLRLQRADHDAGGHDPAVALLELQQRAPRRAVISVRVSDPDSPRGGLGALIGAGTPLAFRPPVGGM